MLLDLLAIWLIFWKEKKAIISLTRVGGGLEEAFSTFANISSDSEEVEIRIAPGDYEMTIDLFIMVIM